MTGNTRATRLNPRWYPSAPPTVTRGSCCSNRRGAYISMAVTSGVKNCLTVHHLNQWRHRSSRQTVSLFFPVPAVPDGDAHFAVSAHCDQHADGCLSNRLSRHDF